MTDNFLEQLKKELEDSKPKFNNGKCKETCNCIEIAEYENGGNPVKNYPCLGGTLLPKNI